MDRSVGLVPQTTVAAAGTFIGDVYRLPLGVRSIALIGKFVFGAGGTTTKVYLQTSIDKGVTWVDIACLAFAVASASKVAAIKADIARAVAAPTDGTLADDTLLDGFIGDRIRVKYVVAGTYTGTTHLTVAAVQN